MNDKDKLIIEEKNGSYQVKTGPLSWTEAHEQRERMIRARQIEKQNKEYRQAFWIAAGIVFVASAIAGYLVAVYVIP